MDHLERSPFLDTSLLSSLQEVLGSLSPPPLPIAVTSSEHVVYGTRLSSEQSKVMILLFGHPALRLDEVRVADGWTRVNRRARIVLEAIVGVKTDGRWLVELAAYWEALPADVKRALQDKHGAWTEVAGVGKTSGKRRTMEEHAAHDCAADDVARADEGSEEAEPRQARSTRKRRAVDGGGVRLDGSDAGSASAAVPRRAEDRAKSFSPSVQATTSVSHYARLTELYDTIVGAFDKYCNIACELEERKNEYAAMEERERLWNERKAAYKSELRAQQMQLEDEQNKLLADNKAAREQAAEVEQRASQAKDDARRAREERREAEVMQKRLESYAVQGMLSQPDVLIEAVRQLVATSTGQTVLRQLQSITSSAHSANDAVTVHPTQRSSTTSGALPVRSTSAATTAAPSPPISASPASRSISPEATAAEALSSIQQTR